MRAVAVLVVLLATLAAGCLRETRDENFLHLAGIDIAAPTVTSGSVVLLVNATLDNSRGGSGPVRVVAKAFDLDSGLLVATSNVSLPGVAKDKTVPVTVPLRVPRQSGYRIEVSVFEDDKLVELGQVQATNIGALQPNILDTGLHIGTIDFTVRNVSGGRVHIQAGVYVTNEGGGPPPALRMQVKAREVSTGLVSDDAWADVGNVAPEETKATQVELDVPDGYNYEVEAVLWDGNVVVERGSGRVQLLPSFTKPAEQEIVVTHPDIRDFVRPEEQRLREELQRKHAEAKTPGFEPLGALAALAGLALLGRRRRCG
jgi:PGF-CTERM protein